MIQLRRNNTEIMFRLLDIKSGYYFGTAVTESEWIEYQKFVDLQGFVCNTGLFLFITAIIVKIVLYVKFKRK